MKILVFLIVVLSVLFGIYFLKNRDVVFEKVMSIEVKSFGVSSPIGFEVYHNKSEFNRAYALKDISEVQSYLNSNLFDFENYSCLVVFGSEVNEINYSWEYVYFEDTCPMKFNKESIPVRVSYKDSSQGDNKIYFYRVPKKPKIRNLCG